MQPLAAHATESTTLLTYNDLYHPPDVEEAYAVWGASCGPAALAAILQRPVMSLRPSLGDFEHRGYCNVYHLLDALAALGFARQTRTLNASQLHHALQTAAVPSAFPPVYGLAFVQWTGPWCQPGVPVAAQYRHTHWVGIAMTQDHGQMVYDINAWSDNDVRGAWVPRQWWDDAIRPVITSTIKRATGGYYVRTALEVRHAHP